MSHLVDYRFRTVCGPKKNYFLMRKKRGLLRPAGIPTPSRGVFARSVVCSRDFAPDCSLVLRLDVFWKNSGPGGMGQRQVQGSRKSGGYLHRLHLLERSLGEGPIKGSDVLTL